MRHRFHLLPILAVAALLSLPATAPARTRRVVPFRTVAGIPLKLPAQVRHRLGRPSHTVRVGGKVRADFVGVSVGYATPKIRYHTV